MKTIFFGPETSIWKCLFWDMTDASNGIAEEYCNFYKKTKNRFEEILISEKVLKYLPHFLKKVIYKYILKYNFFDLPKDTELLFAFTNGFEMCADIEKFIFFVDFLKENFPKSKFALHFYESLSVKESPFARRYNDLSRRFDLLLTFNHYDEERFGIKYYGPICEKGSIIPVGKGEESDIFYAGNSVRPERVDMVLSVFKCLSDKMVKCIFFVYGLDEKKEKEIASSLNTHVLNKNQKKYIAHQNSKLYFEYIPYAHTLQYINCSKCLLEIVLPMGLSSCTARLAQAVNYDKKLITNCPTTVDEPFYHSENILVFEKPEDIDINFFEKPYLPINQDFSASKMIQYVKKRLYG